MLALQVTVNIIIEWLVPLGDGLCPICLFGGRSHCRNKHAGEKRGGGCQNENKQKDCPKKGATRQNS